MGCCCCCCKDSAAQIDLVEIDERIRILRERQAPLRARLREIGRINDARLQTFPAYTAGFVPHAEPSRSLPQRAAGGGQRSFGGADYGRLDAAGASNFDDPYGSSMNAVAHEEFRRLGAVFHTVDADGSGKISRGELSHFLKFMGIPEDFIEIILVAMDADGDGEIDMGEWLEHLPPEVRVMILQKADRRGAMEGFTALRPLVAVFHQFDEDSSGTIGVKELTKALACLGLNEDAGRRAKMAIQQMDVDGNGEIDMQEWNERLPADLRQLIESRVNEHGLVDGFISDGANEPMIRALFDDVV